MKNFKKTLAHLWADVPACSYIKWLFDFLENTVGIATEHGELPSSLVEFNILAIITEDIFIDPFSCLYLYLLVYSLKATSLLLEKNHVIFNRPCVAGAVLQTPSSLFNSLSE